MISPEHTRELSDCHNGHPHSTLHMILLRHHQPEICKCWLLTLHTVDALCHVTWLAAMVCMCPGCSLTTMVALCFSPPNTVLDMLALLASLLSTATSALDSGVSEDALWSLPSEIGLSATFFTSEPLLFWKLEDLATIALLGPGKCLKVEMHV